MPQGGPLPFGLSPSGEMSSYQPTLRETATDWLARNWYGDNRQGTRSAEKLMNVMDFTPFGLAPMMYDAGRAAGGGNYLDAGINMAMAIAPGPNPKGIRAFHGSPHDFDKFSMDRIGTGEGAQAYGHGLYFAENEGTARSYRDALSPGKIIPGAATGRAKYTVAGATMPGGISGHAALDTAQEIDSLLAYEKMGADPGMRKYLREKIERRIAANRATEPQYQTGSAWDDMKNLADFYDEKVRNLNPKDVAELPPGKMYEVNINADPDSFLDWDKPFSKQPEAIQELIWPNENPAKMPRSQMLGTLDNRYPTGGNIYESKEIVPGDFRNSGQASEKLKQAGIPGIKYLDAGSRAKGDGSRNYVLFDDKLVEIVRKYGWAGLLPALGALPQDSGTQ